MLGNQSFVGLDTTMAWDSANYIEQFSGIDDRGVLTIDDYSVTRTQREFNWQIGLITIEAEDGSSLSIEPISGQPNTFIIGTGSGERFGPVFADVKR